MYRAVVSISPHRSIFGPSRAIREADLASHRHLAAPLAHSPYCSSHAVSIVEIERRKARREWRDLVAGIQRFGSNGLQFGQGVILPLVIYDNMRVDSEKYSTKSFGVNYSR